MKIRRTGSSWLVEDRGVTVGPGEPVSVSPAQEVQDLPPLRLRKTGSSNWSFLSKVLFVTFFLHNRSCYKKSLILEES